MDKKKEEISLHTKEVEQMIEKYLPKEEGFQKKVIEAMNYSFLAGGKRNVCIFCPFLSRPGGGGRGYHRHM